MGKQQAWAGLVFTLIMSEMQKVNKRIRELSNKVSSQWTGEDLKLSKAQNFPGKCSAFNFPQISRTL